MRSVHWRAAAVRFGVLMLGLLAAVALLAALFWLAGRPPRPALAGAFGVVGLILAVAAVVMLGASRRGSGRVTSGTAYGTLVLSVPFLAASLVS